jgi:hypothetical protein
MTHEDEVRVLTLIGLYVSIAFWIATVISILIGRKVLRHRHYAQRNEESPESTTFTNVIADSASPGDIPLDNLIVDIPGFAHWMMMLYGFSWSKLPECPPMTRYSARLSVFVTYGYVMFFNIYTLLYDSSRVLENGVTLTIIVFGCFLLTYEWKSYQEAGPLIHTLFPSANPAHLQHLRAVIKNRSYVAVCVAILAGIANSIINEAPQFGNMTAIDYANVFGGCVFYALLYGSILVSMIPGSALAASVYLLKLSVTEDLFDYVTQATPTARRGRSMASIISLHLRQQRLLGQISDLMASFLLPLAAFYVFTISTTVVLLLKNLDFVFPVVLSVCLLLLLLYMMVPAAQASAQMARLTALMSASIVGGLNETQRSRFVPTLGKIRNKGVNGRLLSDWAELSRAMRQENDLKNGAFRGAKLMKQMSGQVAALNQNAFHTTLPAEDVQYLTSVVEALRSSDTTALAFFGIDLTFQFIRTLLSAVVAFYVFVGQVALAQATR